MVRGLTYLVVGLFALNSSGLSTRRCSGRSALSTSISIRDATTGEPSCRSVQVNRRQLGHYRGQFNQPKLQSSVRGNIECVETRVESKLNLSLKENMESVLSPAKDVLTSAYRSGSYVFMAIAAILFVIPDHTATLQLGAKFGGAAGCAIAGGLCNILASANDKDRLSSDTYVRLNLGLLGFSGVGLFFVPAEAGFFFRASPAIALSLVLTLAQAYGALLSFLGWRRGVDPTGRLPVEALAQEVKEGTISTLKGLRVEHAKQARGYRNCLCLVVLGLLANIVEGNFNYRYMEAFHRSWFEVSLNGSAVSRLFMISTMIYSLKDAGERNRLTGTTFIQLNTMIGIWALVVAMGQSIYPLGFAFFRGFKMLAFSILFFTKAFQSFTEKQADKKQLDTTG